MAALDRSQFELYAYPTHEADDALRAHLQSYFTEWRALTHLDDATAAKVIHADGIHLLLDLSGHTEHNRLPLFAWRPAPVQATWLGYFATTGISEMDYIIADPWVLLVTEEQYFVETVWRLPQTRLCFSTVDIDQSVAPSPAAQTGCITFGCFNNLTKINDAVVKLWARVLQALPASRLLLKAKQLGESAVRDETYRRFKAAGIAPHRLVIDGPQNRADYLAAYGRVDIALDPFPFPGGTTTAESLWMGVPVITLAGERFLSRQGVGLLVNAGLSEWVANDEEQYVAIAVKQASDIPGLALLRQSMRKQLQTSTVFDGTRFAEHLGAALVGMWGDRGANIGRVGKWQTPTGII